MPSPLLNRPRDKRRDQRSEEAQAWRYLYNTGRWKRMRLAFLREHPFCVYCKPRLQIAEVVDHIIPHKGDEALFWDVGNWQPMCQPHHDSTKKREEARGSRVQPIGLDGWPISE